MEVFLAAAQPSAAMHAHLERMVGEIVTTLLKYVGYLETKCGSVDELVAPSLDKSARLRLSAQTPLMLCTVLNNIFGSASKLNDLWNEIDAGWRRAVGVGESVGELDTAALDRALRSIRRSAGGTCQYFNLPNIDGAADKKDD